MTHTVLSGSGITLLLFILYTLPYQSASLEHYCQQDVTDTITGETEGKIITRQQGESFYGNNLRCSWLIDGGEGKNIKLKVLSTDFEWVPPYATCSSYDNLKIIEGQSKNGDVITSICGDRNPYHMISQGRYLYLYYETTHQNFEPKRGIELLFQVFDNSTCPPDWFTSDDEWCFSTDYQGTATWLESQTICSYSRANLASITTEDDFQLVYAHGENKTKRAWVGLNDRVSEGTFTWIDRQKRTFQRQFSFCHALAHWSCFRRTSPNDDGSDCVAQDFATGDWVVEKCDKDLNYICKARKDGSTKIYSAFQSSDNPEAGGKEDSISYVIIIIVVLAVVIVGVIIVACLCVRRRNNNRKKLAYLERREHTTTRPSRSGRDTPQELTQLNPPPQDTRSSSTPSAPPAEPVMTYDTQLVAPPTYEESRYDPVLPSEY